MTAPLARALPAPHSRLTNQVNSSAAKRTLSLTDPAFAVRSPSSLTGAGGGGDRAGKRRPIHPCSNLDRDGVCRPGDQRRAWELLSLINSLNHGSTPAGIATYKVEPYVVVADVYGVAPHTGRGGWTWYTGSAGWMYRLIVESLLGLRSDVDTLSFLPCLPDEWRSYKLHYRLP